MKQLFHNFVVIIKGNFLFFTSFFLHLINFNEIIRLESEVLKQQHRIDKLLNPQYSNNQHLIQEIRKDIEKSVLVRQLKAQVRRKRRINRSNITC